MPQSLRPVRDMRFGSVLWSGCDGLCTVHGGEGMTAVLNDVILCGGEEKPVIRLHVHISPFLFLLLRYGYDPLLSSATKIILTDPLHLRTLLLYQRHFRTLNQISNDCRRSAYIDILAPHRAMPCRWGRSAFSHQHAVYPFLKTVTQESIGLGARIRHFILSISLASSHSSARFPNPVPQLHPFHQNASMHPLPKPAIISLLTSLVTASVQNDSSPPDPLLLLPSNSTATPPNSSPADPRYPSATSIPANPTDNTTLNASSPRAPRIIRSGRNLRLASCLRRPRPHGRHLRAQNLRGSATPTLPGLARWDANLPLRILGRSSSPSFWGFFCCCFFFIFPSLVWVGAGGEVEEEKNNKENKNKKE